MKFLSTTFSLAHVLQGSMGREFFYFFKILSTVTSWSGPECMCGNTLAAGRKHSWVAHATTICDICAIWQRDFSVFPGRQAPSLHCCHGHILSQSILEWRRVLSCCFPRRLCTFHFLVCNISVPGSWFLERHLVQHSKLMSLQQQNPANHSLVFSCSQTVLLI